jgi:hypothetical protein
VCSVIAPHIRRTGTDSWSYAVQRRYRVEGRVNKLHPAHNAARVRASKRRWKKTVKEQEQQGIKPRRHGFTNLEGI